MKFFVFAPSTLSALLLALTTLGDYLGSPQSSQETAELQTRESVTSRAPVSPVDLEADQAPIQQVLATTGLPSEALPERLVYGEALLRTVAVRRGDTLMALLERADVPRTQAYEAIKALRGEFDPRRLRAGQEINLHFEDDSDGRTLVSMTLDVTLSDSIEVSRVGEEQFSAERVERPLKSKMIAASGEIKSSLFAAGAKSGVPMAVLSAMLRAYAWDIDFQRDIRRGDRFEILYDTAVSEEGEIVRHGVIHYANLTVGGEEKPLYRYVDRQGHADFYRPDGTSVRKALLRTPVDGARISSGYGMRRHPILGYSKMHKGVDFAAPTGTPVYAAGDGVVERANRYGSYGNYVRIRHNGRISTAYAHLNRIAKGLSRGDKVSQRQLIGYVGSTGRSTGPHLHYEVLVQGEQANPNSVDLPVERNLAGADLSDFRAMVAQRRDQWAALTPKTQLAANLGADPKSASCDQSAKNC